MICTTRNRLQPEINTVESSTVPAVAEQAFSTFVVRLGTLCEAERPLCAAMYGDPAFDDWFRAAEVARSAVLAAADAVVHAPVASATDMRFRAVALNFEAMLLTTNPTKYAGYFSFFRNEARLFYVAGRGARVQHANNLLRTCRRHLMLLLSCEDYLPEALNAVEILDAPVMPQAA